MRNNRERFNNSVYQWRKENPKAWNRIRKKHIDKCKALILKVLGSKCVLCDSKKNLAIHEIHGKKHPKGSDKYTYIANHLEDFVRLCSGCHIFLHYLRHKKINLDKLMRLFECLK